MENNQVNFEKPLRMLKDELDSLEVSITGLKDNMNTLKPYVDQFVEAGHKKKELNHEKRVKQGVLNTMLNYYEKATGKIPDGIYPLFSQDQE